MATYLNVTELSVKIKDEFNKNLSKVKLNKILLNIGFMEKINDAYSPVSEYGVLKERDGYSFCVWSIEIFNDSMFIDAINDKDVKPLKKGISVSPKKEALNEGVKYDKKYLTFSQISKEVSIPSKEIKVIFAKLDYYEQDGKNEVLLKKSFGKQITSKEYGNTYILWDDDILKNVHLKPKKVVKPSIMSSIKKTISKVTHQTEETPKATTKETKKSSYAHKSSAPKSSVYIEIDRDKWDNDWYIKYGRLLETGTDSEIKAHEKKKPGKYRTNRGDSVPSKNELSLVNIANDFGLPYILGEVVKEIDEVVVTDIYFPFEYIKNDELVILDVYGEYWGDLGDAYDKNKQRKRDLSTRKDQEFILMEFPSKTSEDMSTRFERIFNDHPAIRKTGMKMRDLIEAHWKYKVQKIRRRKV